MIGNRLSTWMAYSLIGTIPAVFAYRLSDWSPVEEFSAGRRPTLVISGLFLLYFVFVTIPAQPLAALILPLLLGMVYLGLPWNRQAETEVSVSTAAKVKV